MSLHPGQTFDSCSKLDELPGADSGNGIGGFFYVRLLLLRRSIEGIADAVHAHQRTLYSILYEV